MVGVPIVGMFHRRVKDGFSSEFPLGFSIFGGQHDGRPRAVVLGDDVDFPVFDVVGSQDSVTMFESLDVGGFDVVTEASPFTTVVPPNQLGEVDGLLTDPRG